MLLVFNNPVSRAMLTRGRRVPRLRLNQDLAEFIEGNKERFHFNKLNRKALYHGHCHHKAVMQIEKDKALERRFQQVYVGEPNVEDTIAILRGLKERYEVHHGVRIKDAAIVAAATLSNRYITDRFLPDKAIDLIDEAASRLRIEIDSLPLEIDELEREILQLEIERQALSRETDEKSKERLADIEKRIANLNENAYCSWQI